jgi:cytochrome c553
MSTGTKRIRQRLLIGGLAACVVLAFSLVLAEGQKVGQVARKPAAGDCGPMPDKKVLREVLAELMRASVPPRSEPSALPEPNSLGAKLLTTYCTQCHGLPDPKSYSGDKWPDVMERMVLRMKALGSRRCNLLQLTIPTTDEQRTILAYLHKNAFESLYSGPPLPLKGTGAMAFINYCSQCHDPPHPRQHIAAEWPAVVDRMQEYAYFIGRNPINDQEKAAILEFLKSEAR